MMRWYSSMLLITHLFQVIKTFPKKDFEFEHLATFQILKIQPCKLYNDKYRIPSTQITNTEIFAFIAVRVFKLLSCKALLINRKDNRNC